MITTPPQGHPDPIAPPTTLGRVARSWLPIEDRSIVHFFNRNLYYPHRLRERLTASARQMVSLNGALLPQPPDLTAVLDPAAAPRSVRLPSADSDRVESHVEESDLLLLERVREVVREFADHPILSVPENAPSPGNDRERWILIKDNSRTDRMIALLFALDGNRPSLALKMAPTEVGSLTRERDALLLLRSALPEDLVASLPQPGALKQIGGWQVLPLSIVEGRPAYVEMLSSWQPRRTVARHLQCAVQWLVRFQRETCSDRAFLSRPDEQDTLMEWGRGLEAAGIEKLSWFESLLLRCQKDPIPLCAGHGDFWVRNLLLPDERRQPGLPLLPGVIDWESFRPQQGPFVDLFHFAVTYGLNYPWARYRRIEPLEALHGTFVDNNHLSREISHFFSYYCHRTGVEPDQLRSLFRLYLLRLSTRDAPNSLQWSIRPHLDPNTWLELYNRVRRARFMAVDV